jgi:hypothetical protein
MSARSSHSLAGVVSFGLGLAMVLVEAAVFVAASLGLKYNHGKSYILGIPLDFMLFAFFPCIILAMIGLAQRRRRRVFALVGLGLALVAILGIAILMRSFRVPSGLYMGATGAGSLRVSTFFPNKSTGKSRAA